MAELGRVTALHVEAHVENLESSIPVGGFSMIIPEGKRSLRERKRRSTVPNNYLLGLYPKETEPHGPQKDLHKIFTASFVIAQNWK